MDTPTDADLDFIEADMLEHQEIQHVDINGNEIVQPTDTVGTGEALVRLESETLAFFLYIAGEAVHWDWTPPLEGLMPFSREQKGCFMHLKKCDLLWVFEKDTDNHQINFTKAGVALAKAHGVEIGLA
jgi:hypothetical protein